MGHRIHHYGPHTVPQSPLTFGSLCLHIHVCECVWFCPPPAPALSAGQTVWRIWRWSRRWSSRRQRWRGSPSRSAGRRWTEVCTECSSGTKKKKKKKKNRDRNSSIRTKKSSNVSSHWLMFIYLCLSSVYSQTSNGWTVCAVETEVLYNVQMIP